MAPPDRGVFRIAGSVLLATGEIGVSNGGDICPKRPPILRP
jgi:hypothetical protein